MYPEGWSKRAECAGKHDTMELPHLRAEAKALCASCPVVAQCLDHLMRSEVGKPAGERAGYGGGMSAVDRARHEAQLKTCLECEGPSEGGLHKPCRDALAGERRRESNSLDTAPTRRYRCISCADPAVKGDLRCYPCGKRHRAETDNPNRRAA